MSMLMLKHFIWTRAQEPYRLYQWFQPPRHCDDHVPAMEFWIQSFKMMCQFDNGQEAKAVLVLSMPQIVMLIDRMEVIIQPTGKLLLKRTLLQLTKSWTNKRVHFQYLPFKEYNGKLTKELEIAVIGSWFPFAFHVFHWHKLSDKMHYAISFNRRRKTKCHSKSVQFYYGEIKTFCTVFSIDGYRVAWSSWNPSLMMIAI